MNAVHQQQMQQQGISMNQVMDEDVAAEADLVADLMTGKGKDGIQMTGRHIRQLLLVFNSISL